MNHQTIDLEKIKKEYSEKINLIKRRIIVCAGTGCVANGSRKILKEFEEQLKLNGIDHITDLKFETCKENNTLISESGCQGFCQMGPLVTIEPDGIMYVVVKPEDVARIVVSTLCGGEIIEDLLYVDQKNDKKCRGESEIPFYKLQQRFVLKKCGKINPEDINEYIYEGGYEASRRALIDMTNKDICDEMISSGLRGRGGGGFPTGRKWDITRIENNEKKYVICNGDEGDPGAFMDRSIMEGNPHSVIEGMIIAAKAIGADEGYVYVRAEYPFAVKRIRKAVDDALNFGMLGQNIFNSGFSFNINVMEGAGAFVCGEETALMSSIQGKRGMPNSKPPFPSQSGLFDKPTIINNVETLSTVPLIINNGLEKFIGLGTEKSNGTKTFALTGHVVNTGLIEVPFGTTLREIVYDIGGGLIDDNGNPIDEEFKAVQIGGPSGGCLTKEHLDMPLDFDSLTGIGAMVGSGGLVVMNKNTCIVQIAKFFMQFTQNESCGKCVLCREGTKQMLALLNDIIEGKADEDTIPLLEDLAYAVKKGSLCGLGKTAPNPVLSSLKYFREEYNLHITDKKCPAKKCRSLTTPRIISELCIGCGLCIRKCPVDAITGSKKEVHKINESTCIRCGACIEICRLNAIVGE